MKLPYNTARIPPDTSTTTDNSLLRRLSIKATIGSLQDEILQDLGSRVTRNSTGDPADLLSNGGAKVSRLSRMNSDVGHLCNNIGSGGVGNSNRNPNNSRCCRQKTQLQDEILKTLQVLISRQELDDECEEISNEWRQVAQVIDRLLFWVFLVATVAITLVLLIIIPLVRHAQETDELDEKLFGMTQHVS